ncbi:MAG: type II toxin-antitoxin system VapC family toxin [Acidobacteria bacterium]|nr:MAG: type II toxin-antitoxin system VapC family toxin [Acidobacteriota bacterium]REK03268.1 MAG: type II toxin-antitoxin system VapC family toxin [Acidobacteriota bacterium]
MAIAAFSEWHRLHEEAASVLEDGAAIPAHALLETWSVLTGFPPPHRAPADIVRSWLDDRLPRIIHPPDGEAQRMLVHRLGRDGRIGGAVYDGLVGLTAKRAGALLVTADRRAVPVYELVGVDFRLLSGRR